MKLPIFNTLLSDSSTYISFSKALLDLDIANNGGTPYYFSKLVALNLPDYKNPDFFIDLSSVGVISDNPNTVIPKGMQFYMENIMRQKVNTENVTELAFYKFLNKCGLPYETIQNSITFVNNIATSNFTYVENNNGWGEVVGVIPNKCAKLTNVFKTLDIADIISSDAENSDGLFDNGNKEFIFTNPEAKKVLDFNNLIYDTSIENETFQFNVLLVFYRDKFGIDKLHGINFINPFENKITYFDLPTYEQKNNNGKSVGYQFKFNLKTCNNEASQIIVQDYNADGTHWNTYFETLTKLNSFLETQMRKEPII